MAQGTVGTPERKPPLTQGATKGDYVSSEQDKGQGKVFVAMGTADAKVPRHGGFTELKDIYAAVALGARETMY